MPKLRDVTGQFARGEAALGALRAAARTEPVDRHLADEVLKLISEWERSAWPNSAWSRNELRARANSLIPEPVAPATRPKDPTAIMYEAGLRGQRRRD